jgi:hypothetical protein
MATVESEYQQAIVDARIIEQSGGDEEGLAATFRGLSTLLLAILYELREIKEDQWLKPDA